MVKMRNPKSEIRKKAEDRNPNQKAWLRVFGLRVSVFGLRNSTQSGVLMIELLVAMALVAGVVLPIAYSISYEKHYARALYQRAVAMEIVDGEIEVLAAGEWRSFTNGVQEYPVHAGAATNLPPGRFVLTLSEQKVRLEWRPAVKQHGGPVLREVAK